MKHFCLSLLVIVLLSACTDATIASITSYGSSARITCFSGGKITYDGFSTGKVLRAPEGADGYAFKDAQTNRYREVTGDCNVDYDAPQTSLKPVTAG